MITKRAIEVQSGDIIAGPTADFTEKGEVESTVVVDRGVQINYVDGTRIVRPEDYVFTVE